MDLNERRRAAASEIYKKLDICGSHFSYSAESAWDWEPADDGLKRAVEFEEELSGGTYDRHLGSFSVFFEKGTSFPSRILTQIQPGVSYASNGEKLQAFLRSYLPHLASPFTTSIHVKVARKYDADYAEVSAQNSGAVTTKALARHMLAPFQAEFGTISALSFKRNEDEGTYEIEIRLPLAGFPDAGMELSKFSPEQLLEVIAVGEAFEDRLRKATPPGTAIDYSEITIKTPTHSYSWWGVLDAQRTYDIRNGINLECYDADEVAAATVLQIGDHAVMQDSAADCYAVARIDEDGLCHPVKGDLSHADAEAMLKELTNDADPVFQVFAA